MTAFEELERGYIVWASDPLSEKGRPMLVLGAPRFLNHGVQLINLEQIEQYYGELATRQEMLSRDDFLQNTTEQRAVERMVESRSVFFDVNDLFRLRVG